MQAKSTNSLLGFGVRPSEGQTAGQTGNQRFWVGLVAVLVAVGIYAFANANETRMGLFWVLGLGFGAVDAYLFAVLGRVTFFKSGASFGFFSIGHEPVIALKVLCPLHGRFDIIGLRHQGGCAHERGHA